MTHARAALLVTGSLLLFGCSGKSSGGATGGASAPDSGGACASGMLQEGGKCVDPLRRYEPADAVDTDNVVSYSTTPLTLKLPPPPKSGFRLVVPPRHLEPGDEVEACQAWAFPAIKNRNVYAARVYTTGALHHSNMFGVPLSPDKGPSPYPDCNPGQDSVQGQVGNMLQGNIMDVLFANSTQIDGGEQIVFPKGMAFKITTEGREVTTTIHWLNVDADPKESEVVYDFFTMSDADLEQEIAPFVYENEAFSIAPHTTGQIATTCDLLHQGNIVSIMPHTHKRATAFDVDLVRADGTTESVFHDGSFDTSSDIKVFDQPISMDGFTKIHHACTVNNDLSDPIVWGIGNNEMCTLFGYLYPPGAQQLGFVGGSANADGSSPACITLDIGAHRK